MMISGPKLSVNSNSKQWFTDVLQNKYLQKFTGKRLCWSLFSTESVFFEKFSSQEEFWFDMTSRLHVSILVLSREVGYLF